jgi:hypothetical protein
MTDSAAAPRALRAAAGAWLGASLWLSAGTLAATHAPAVTRVGTLPEWRWLAVAVAVGAVTAAAVPLRRAVVSPLTALALLWLPWLPWRVPAPFLLWEGPLEGVVWTAVAAAAAWRGVEAWAAGRLAPWWVPPRAPIAAAVVAGLIFATAWAVARPRVPAGDEPHYLVITQSLLHDGDLRIENNHEQEQYLAYYDRLLKPDFLQRGIDHRIYSIHAPGLSALVLPAFAVAGYGGAVATVVAVVAAATGAAWLAAFWVTGSGAAAWAAWLALVGAAPFALHSFTIYPDAVGAAAAMAGVLALAGLDRGRAESWTRRRWAAIGAALALLPWLHTRFALVAAVLGTAIVLRLLSRRAAAATIGVFLTVPTVAALGWFTYFWRIFGTPNPAAPYGARPEGGLGFVPTGVTGLLVDQQFGLVANAPVLAAGLLGLVVLAGRRRRLAVELTALVVPYLVAVATYPMWWGGYSAPGRFALVVLPALALPVAACWASGPAGRGLVAVLTAVSAAITALLVGRDRGAMIYNGRDGHALLLDWLSPTVDLTLGLPSVHRDGALTAAGDAAIWGLAGLVVAGGWTWLSRRRPRPELAPAAAVLAAPVAAMMALPVVWAGGDRPAITPPTSQMTFLERWHPAARPLAVETPPLRRVALEALLPRLSLSTSLRGHRLPGVSPLLRIPLMPAGEFDVVAEGQSRLEGMLTVQLGRDGHTMARWALDGRPGGATGLVVRLPAMAHSITITGDDAARAAIRRLTLRPRRLTGDETAAPLALRAVRYGGVVVFALDDNHYVEPGAIWVRGERTTRVIVHPDGAAPVLRLQGGAVANTVTLSARGWEAVVPLGADERREVVLPATALAPAVLSIASASGFRPSDHAAGSSDGRWLGVYLTWP